jgi:enoyl-CoA hydratase
VSVDYDLRGAVKVESDGGVRIVTLNRPEQLNAVNEDLHWALTNVWRQLSADRKCMSVVLTGMGRAFCAGGDLEWLRRINADREGAEWQIHQSEELILEIVRFPKPLIAAVNGPAVGFGCSLAVLSDIVFLSDRAYLQDPHVTVGLVSGDGGAAWPLLTSLHRAKECLFTGQRISPADAVTWGLANRVIPHENLLQSALELGHLLERRPQSALRDTKRFLNSYLSEQIATPMRLAALAEREHLASADFGAGLDSRSGSGVNAQ